MAKKAVYSNKGLQVYITKEDFEELLSQKRLSVPVVIGKNPISIGLVRLELSNFTRDGLLNALTLEKQAVDEAGRGAPKWMLVGPSPNTK